MQKPLVRGPRPSLCDEKEGGMGEVQSETLPAAAGGRRGDGLSFPAAKEHERRGERPT